MTTAMALLAAYALGSFPSAHLTSKLFRGVAITRTGSGNAGAMNVIRNVGWVPGLLTLAMDLGKGYLAADIGTAQLEPPLVPMALTAAVLGHNYSAFMGFKGGKGLASLAGGLILLSPKALVAVFLGMALLSLLLRDTGAGAAVAIGILPPALWAVSGNAWWAVSGVLTVSAVVSKHRRDIEEYLAGRRKLI